jgi:hypothetical protein
MIMPTLSGIPDEEGAMCRRSEYDLYARTSSKPARTNSKPARSLVEVLRDLFRPRRPQVAQAEVVPFRLRSPPAPTKMPTAKVPRRPEARPANRSPRRAEDGQADTGLQHATNGFAIRY